MLFCRHFGNLLESGHRSLRGNQLKTVRRRADHWRHLLASLRAQRPLLPTPSADIPEPEVSRAAMSDTSSFLCRHILIYAADSHPCNTGTLILSPNLHTIKVDLSNTGTLPLQPAVRKIPVRHFARPVSPQLTRFCRGQSSQSASILLS